MFNSRLCLSSSNPVPILAQITIRQSNSSTMSNWAIARLVESWTDIIKSTRGRINSKNDIGSGALGGLFPCVGGVEQAATKHAEHNRTRGPIPDAVELN
jgi:hypothetical protein